MTRLLSERYHLETRPGGRYDCPFCGKHTFVVTKDDRLAKCFHPQCCKAVTLAYQDQQDTGLYTILDQLATDWKIALLASPETAAYQYLTDTRGLHPQVIAEAPLGIIPDPCDIPSYFAKALTQAHEHVAHATDALSQAEGEKDTKTRQKALDAAQKTLDLLYTSQQKLTELIGGRAGWIVFVYTDAFHRVTSLRLRKPDTKVFVSFKPFRWSGCFGHGMVSLEASAHRPGVQRLLVVEGETNQLQLQSLCVRNGYSYVWCGAVGSVTLADIDTLQRLTDKPLVCYDHDASGAGYVLVERLQEEMSVEAFTTPAVDSDLDDFIRGYGADYQAAWEGVKQLIATRQALTRNYAGKPGLFFEHKTFIPKRLGDALLDLYPFRYTAEMLWVYRDGAYRAKADQVVKAEAQRLLGEEVRDHRIAETLHYIERASYAEHPVPNPHAEVPEWINVRNGRLHWPSGTLKPHDPAYFDIAQLPIAYDPTATCPVFDRYLRTTLEDEIHPLVEEWLGYCTLPTTRYEKTVMCLGEGENGKSVLLDTLAALLGPENIATDTLQSLEENRFRVAELFGKLANICADLDYRALKSTEIFKKVTTGDFVTAERKGKDPFQFRPYARMIYSANRIPKSWDKTHAYYRRWLIIPFTRTFSGKDRDEHLRDKLIQELPGILNRALAGLCRLVAQGAFTLPASVQRELEKYRQYNDVMEAFIVECVRPDPAGLIEKKHLHKVHLAWCQENGIEHPAPRNQAKKALERLFPSVTSYRYPGKPWCWKGISLTEDAPFVAEDPDDAKDEEAEEATD